MACELDGFTGVGLGRVGLLPPVMLLLLLAVAGLAAGELAEDLAVVVLGLSVVAAMDWLL